MKLSRGTGLKGMEGINNYSILEDFEELKIYRPFIKIKKEDLLEYCLINNEKPIYDVTNEILLYLANGLRIFAWAVLQRYFFDQKSILLHFQMLFLEQI